MSAEKTKEDEMFFEFLESNPGAMQLYNMVLQKKETNAIKTGKSPRKSLGAIGARTSIVPLKSPGKAPHNVMPIGKSPRKSFSTTNVIGKSPAKPQQPILPIGKSPKKSMSVTNVRVPNSNRKSWMKIEQDLRSVDKSENSESVGFVPQLTSMSTPARKEKKFTNLNDLTTSSDLGTSYDIPATVQHRRYGSASNPIETPLSLPRPLEELKNEPEIALKKEIQKDKEEKVKSKKSRDPQTRNRKSKREAKDGDKKKKISKKKKDIGTDSEDDVGPPPPCHVPPPPPIDFPEMKVDTLDSPHVDPYSIFTKVVNLSSGLDISTKDLHLRAYKHSFFANTLVDWIVENGFCKTREIATEYGFEMQKLGFIESVSKATNFKDAKLLFQLSSKGKLIRSEQASTYFGQVFDPRNGVDIKDRAWHLKKYKACFLGEEFVSWFITNNVVMDRNRAVRIGREFFENHLIEHVSQEHHFKDGPFLYHLTREGVIRRMQTYSVSSLTKQSMAMKSSERSNSESKQTEQLDNKDNGESFEVTGIDEVEEKTSLDVAAQPEIFPKANIAVLKLESLSETTFSKSKRTKAMKKVDEDKLTSDSDSEALPPKNNRRSRRFSASLGSTTVLSPKRTNATEFLNSHIKSNVPLVPVHRTKGPANRRLPTKFAATSNQNPSIFDQTNQSPLIPVEDRAQSTKVEPIVSSISDTKNLDRKKLNAAIALELEKKFQREADVVPQSGENKKRENTLVTNTSIMSPSELPYSLEHLLKDESGMKSFRQYLVKNCKFQELDFTNFLHEVFCVGRETNIRQRTLLIREVYKTYISDSSPTYLPLPKEIINKIQSMIDSRSISDDIYEESSRYIQEQLMQVVNDYVNSKINGSCNAEKVPKSPEKICPAQVDSTEKNLNEKILNVQEEQIKAPVSKEETRDAFLHNLDFCYAVSTFKVNYLTKTAPERTEEALAIVSKFLNTEKPIISVSNEVNLAQALQAIKVGVFKIDVFDKLLSDVAEVLNSSSKPAVCKSENSKPESRPTVIPPPSNTTKLITSKIDAVPVRDTKSSTIIQPTENTSSSGEKPLMKEPTTPGKAWRPRNKVVKDVVLTSKVQENFTPVSVTPPEKPILGPSDSLVWVRVTDRDPKTNLVSGRIWRQHNYRVNSEGSKLCCYLTAKSTEIEELCIDFSKLSSVKDITESEQLSEPENCRFACSISVLRLIFACGSVEERSAWISYVREKFLAFQSNKDIKVTPLMPLVVEKSPEAVDKTPINSTTDNIETAKTERFSIILRRFNKRGGVRIPIPDSIDELLSIASEKLKIAAVRLREVETEAEITEISLFRPDMLVWVMTSEEEQEFV